MASTAVRFSATGSEKVAWRGGAGAVGAGPAAVWCARWAARGAADPARTATPITTASAARTPTAWNAMTHRFDMLRLFIGCTAPESEHFLMPAPEWQRSAVRRFPHGGSGAG